MALSLRCECGDVEGKVDSAHAYARATCYCHDCQAYAKFLDRPGITDDHGGTDIVAMDPAAVRITSGGEHVACMSLSDKGLLRWYAACCRTPLGNTPRDAKTAYLGLATTCLVASPAIARAFGPEGRVVLNAGSAKGKVKSTPVAFVLGGLRIAGSLLGARLRKQAPTLFFDAEGQPVRTPEVLDAPRRKALHANP